MGAANSSAGKIRGCADYPDREELWLPDQALSQALGRDGKLASRAGIHNGGVANYLTLGVRMLCSLLVLSLRGVQFPSAERVGSAEAQRKQVKQARSRSLRRK